jgi:hypothetical protein
MQVHFDAEQSGAYPASIIASVGRSEADYYLRIENNIYKLNEKFEQNLTQTPLSK